MADIVVARYNIVGMGHDTENAAVFSTRFKFTAHCGGLNHHPPKDNYLALLFGIEGITRADVYTHDSLYDVHIKKAAAFSWEELNPQIMQILEFRHQELSNG